MARVSERLAPAAVPAAPADWAALEWARKAGRGLGAGGTVIALLVAWEVFARSGTVSDFLMPPLSVVLERIWDDTLSGDLLANLGQTLYRVMIGFAIAGSLGIALGILIARNVLVRWFFDPTTMIVAIVTEILMGGTGIGGAMIAASRFANLPGVLPAS